MTKMQLIYYLQGMHSAYEVEGETEMAEVVQHILQKAEELEVTI